MSYLVDSIDVCRRCVKYEVSVGKSWNSVFRRTISGREYAYPEAVVNDLIDQIRSKFAGNDESYHPGRYAVTVDTYVLCEGPNASSDDDKYDVYDSLSAPVPFGNSNWCCDIEAYPELEVNRSFFVDVFDDSELNL